MVLVRWTMFAWSRGLATYAPSVSFGHPEHLFFDSLDTQKFRSGFADDDNFRRYLEHVVSLIQYKQSSLWPKKAKSVDIYGLFH